MSSGMSHATSLFLGWLVEPLRRRPSLRTTSLFLGGLVAVVLVLVTGLLGSSIVLNVTWGQGLIVALVVLFLIRLRSQWSPSGVPQQTNLFTPPKRALKKASLSISSQLSRCFEFALFALLAVAIFYQILLVPVVGLADNGDFGRLMDQTGLAYPAASQGEQHNKFINLHFLVGEPHSTAVGYRSSELIFVYAALFLDKIFSANGIFDLRLLGTLHAAALLVGLMLVLTATRSLPRPSRWVAGALVVLVFVDVGYVAYLNALYREAAALGFMVLTFAFALSYIRAAKASLALLSAYFAAAALFVAAKPQHAPLGLLLAAFGLLLSRRWTGWSHRRWASAGMAAMICLVGVWSYFSQPDPLKKAVLYNLIFSDVLVHSQTPREDLTELGLEGEMLRWIGTDAYDKEAPIEDPAFRESFYSQITPSNVAGFYATHPDRALGLLDRAAREGFSLRPGYLGNLEERSGRSPGAQSATFDSWSSLRANFPSKSLAGLTFVLGMAALGGFVVWKRCGTLEAKMLAELFLLLVAMSALEFAVVCLGGGALDTVKHLFAFNLMVDMGAIMAASYVAYWWSKVVN